MPRKNLAKTGGEFALAGANDTARDIEQARSPSHPPRRSRCIVNQDRSQALGRSRSTRWGLAWPGIIPAMETTATTRMSSSQVAQALAAVRELDLPAAAAPIRQNGLDVADIVRTLDADDDVVVAAMLQPLLETRLLEREIADRLFGTQKPCGWRGALSQLGHFGLPPDWTPERRLGGRAGGSAAQDVARRDRRRTLGGGASRRAVTENALRQIPGRRHAEKARRRDPRSCTRRLPIGSGSGGSSGNSRTSRSATLQPLEYKRIAAALNSRRSEREHYIDRLKILLQGELRAAGIEASIDGRPKHIFSIWRKNGGQASRLRATHGHPRRAGAGRHGLRVLRRPSASCIPCGTSFPENSTITSPRPRTTCIAPFIRP